jgi:hypothetical protein
MAKGAAIDAEDAEAPAVVVLVVVLATISDAKPEILNSQL